MGFLRTAYNDLINGERSLSKPFQAANMGVKGVSLLTALTAISQIQAAVWSGSVESTATEANIAIVSAMAFYGSLLVEAYAYSKGRNMRQALESMQLEKS